MLKFNPKPDSLNHHQFIEVKQAIIETAISHGCSVLVSMILHNVATSVDEARRNEINRAIYNFDLYLKKVDSHGLALVDRFSDSQIDSHLREKFAIGITGLPYTEAMRLERIVGYHYSAIGQSHYSSIVDIVLGSLRFAVNAYADGGKQNKIPSARRILRIVSPLFVRNSKTDRVSEISLFFSPKVIKAEKYRQQYEAFEVAPV